MPNENETEVVLWDVEVLGPEGPRRFGALDVESLDAGTRFALHGAASKWDHFHVAADDETRLITELCLLDAVAAGLPRDAEIRVPQQGAWLSLPARAAVRVVGAKQPLSRDELAQVLGGHGPPPVGTTTKNS